MLASVPDSFLIAIILVVFWIVAVLARLPLRIRLLSLVLAAACLLYASFTIVPENKVVILSNVGGIDHNSEPLSQGLQFKPPWDETTEYDDVIFTAPLSYDPEKVPMSRGITSRDFAWSYLADKKVDGSYLLATDCLRVFNSLIQNGQSALDEFTCKFDDKSFLVLRG